MSIPDTASPQTSDDIVALRRLIASRAERCGLDLADRSAMRRLMDGDPAQDSLSGANRRCRDELRAMLILLFRLESSASEELGVAGLRRLWQQHREILARSRVQVGRRPAGAA